MAPDRAACRPWVRPRFLRAGPAAVRTRPTRRRRQCVPRVSKRPRRADRDSGGRRGALPGSGWRQMTEVAEAALGTAGLPAVVNSLAARTGGSTSALGLHLSYLRRKPGRGLVAMFRVDQTGSVTPFVHLAI